MALTGRSAAAALAAAGVIGTIVAAWAARPGTGDIAHGKYLYNQVALCVDCHGVNLKGGPVHFKPAEPMPWVSVAPNIRGGGASKYSQADLMKMMMTGKRPGGGAFLAPMPHYRMNKQDASAVAAYIKSLK